MTKKADRNFWEKHAANYQTAFEKLPELSDYVHHSERRHLFRVLPLSPEMKVLDLGCGTGRWALEFAPHCRRVVGVDFAAGMIERARAEASRRGIENVEFFVKPAEKFRSEETFDLIILSGVLVYFEDDELAQLLKNVADMLRPGGRVVSRETVGIHERQEVQTNFHQKVGDAYAATYRLPEEYIRLFERAGLKLEYNDDFTPLNYPMILYRRLVPQRWKTSPTVRRALKLALKLQYAADPILLKWKFLYRPLYHRFWKIKSMLFIYRKPE